MGSKEARELAWSVIKERCPPHEYNGADIRLVCEADIEAALRAARYLQSPSSPPSEAMVEAAFREGFESGNFAGGGHADPRTVGLAWHNSLARRACLEAATLATLQSEEGGAEAIIRVCTGPPCDGTDPENCQLCSVIDPFDKNWEKRFNLERRGQ
jgi:hypothetical protein